MGVTDLDRLLNIRDKKTKLRIQSRWCDICLHGFQIEKAYLKHRSICKKNIDPTTLYKMPEEQYTKFDDWKKIIKKPFVIYADLESLLVPDDKFDKRHEPLAAAGVLIHNETVDEYATFHGVGCITKFLTLLERWLLKKFIHTTQKLCP